ncbi:MAG TPA: helix-hairpin-helix domain-containing protein [Ramlibacter sp.]|nr:helix-hairpin-helix domain-containing protein [Ramlibacter sp.]
MWKKILAAVLMVLASAIAMAAVDANKANQAELDSMKGIGPATSKSILDERKKGDFKDWQDFIKRVKGIGEKKAENLSANGLTVNGQAYQGTSAAKKEAKAQKKQVKAEKKQAKADAPKAAASGSKK